MKSVSQGKTAGLIFGGGENVFSRTQKIADLYFNHKVDVIIASGKWYPRWEKVPPEVTEAKIIQFYLLRAWVPKEIVFLEENAMDTIGNIFFCKKLYLKPLWIREVYVSTNRVFKTRTKYLLQKILGKEYVVHIQEAPMFERMKKYLKGWRSHEKKSLKEAREWLDRIPDGDDEKIEEMLYKVHKMYK